MLIGLFNLFQSGSSRNTPEISFSDFLISVDNGNVSEVKIIGDSVSGFFDDGRPFSTYSPNYPELVEKLNNSGVKIIIGPVFNESNKYLDELNDVTFLSFTNKIRNNPPNIISGGVNARIILVNVFW